MSNVVGNVPDPNDLYGREDLLDHVWSQLRTHNVLLVAPRRFGKTGVMNHLRHRPRDGYLPLYFNLEDVDSPEEFLWRLTRGVMEQDRLRSVVAGAKGIAKAIVDWLPRIEEVGIEGAKVRFKESVAKSWAAAARKLLRELEQAEPTILFVLDELPDMLRRIVEAHAEEEAAKFTAWFRSVRIDQGETLRRHRFVVGGSTGIDVILRRLKAPDKLNDFERVYVEPIPREDAHRLILDVCKGKGIRMTPELADTLIGHVGVAVPYFIQLFLSQLAQLPSGTRMVLRPENIEEVYRTRVLGSACKRYFDLYRERLSRLSKPRERAAIEMLRAVARDGRVGAAALYDVYAKARRRGASELEFHELVADLECDWYLALDPSTNEYRFLLSVMRDWWHRWYGRV